MRTLAKLFSGPVMMAAGVNHFVMPRTYEAIMPAYLPAHRELVYASGIAEFAAAAATLHPATRRVGGWGLLATLAGVFPANLEMALHPERFRRIPPAALWARLPLQAGMAYLVWRATLSPDAGD
jgi:uncharacterized membrane protein